MEAVDFLDNINLNNADFEDNINDYMDELIRHALHRWKVHGLLFLNLL